MGSTFGGLEIAKRSLFTQQAALLTTGHNIANANTPGYSRQVVNMVAAKPLEAMGMQRSTIPGQMGQSVEVGSVNRMREKFLDSQFQNENKSLGNWGARKDSMDKLESIVNEPSTTGVREVVAGFWAAWQQLSTTPEDSTARVLVKEKALAMTDAVNETGKKLDDLSSDLTNSIDVNIKQDNSMLSELAALNGQIFRIEGLGDNANDLRDQRDLLVDQLSKTMNVSITEESSGYTVKMGNIQLVKGPAVTTPLTTTLVAASYANGDLNSGSLYGMTYSRDSSVAGFKFQLDNMMKVLATGDMQVTLNKGTVVPEGTTLNGVTYSGNVVNRTLSDNLIVTVKGLNGLHELGYSGGTGPLKSGVPFFTIKPGSTDFNSESITVNPDIISDVTNISTSTRTYMDKNNIERVVQGNNDMALLVSDVSSQKINFDPSNTGKPILANGTFDDFYRSFVGELGVQGQEATRQQANQQTLVDQVESNRQSVIGVSLDEEMSNLVKFQHAYGAAARAMTTFDQNLDKIINSMGLVGR